MQTILKVMGMSCSHCEKAVKEAVSAIEGVTSVEVDLEGKTVTVNHEEIIKVDSIKAKIEEEGYKIF